MTNTPSTRTFDTADVVLIGGGIMSATLGALLATLEPTWRIVLLEKEAELATESSAPWNNAGTGHSGYCELNYMPDPGDLSKAESIAAQFHLSREWWAHLAEAGLLDPATFVHATPHMDVVFGRHDVEYLRRRFHTLRSHPLFEDMEFTTDPDVISSWAPLVGEGRTNDEPVAATRVPGGTDVDFGALSRGLADIITTAGGEIRTGHEVRRLDRDADGWRIRGRGPGGEFDIRSPFVFVGAGGYALELLQRARLPEVRGYAVLPVGAAFLRCRDQEVAGRHDAKVYGQADVGAPPMSVPHLDKRIVDGDEQLMFGPFATFSTKLLKGGRLTDVFRTLRWNNLHVIAAALLQNLDLIRYLVLQLLARPSARLGQLRRYYPEARADQWELLAAGQRAQLVKPDRRRIGVIHQGTELVTGADGSIAGLLGASPGASTALPIMLDLLQRCFPEQWAEKWATEVDAAVPNHTATWDAETVRASTERTAHALGLD